MTPITLWLGVGPGGALAVGRGADEARDGVADAIDMPSPLVPTGPILAAVVAFAEPGDAFNWLAAVAGDDVAWEAVDAGLVPGPTIARVAVA